MPRIRKIKPDVVFFCLIGLGLIVNGARKTDYLDICLGFLVELLVVGILSSGIGWLPQVWGPSLY